MRTSFGPMWNVDRLSHRFAKRSVDLDYVPKPSRSSGKLRRHGVVFRLQSTFSVDLTGQDIQMLEASELSVQPDAIVSVLVAKRICSRASTRLV